MKLILLLCSLFILSCVAPLKFGSSLPQTQVDSTTYKLPIDSGWDMYVFDIESTEAYGRAFICNNEIYSANHIFETTDPGASNDIRDLGHTDVYGLDRCMNEHKLDEILFYRTKKGIKYLLIVYIDDKIFGVIPLNPLERGDSGSPVLCLKDNGVVGIVSHLMENDQGICVGGKIARLPLATKEEK